MLSPWAGRAASSLPRPALAATTSLWPSRAASTLARPALAASTTLARATWTQPPSRRLATTTTAQPLPPQGGPLTPAAALALAASRTPPVVVFTKSTCRYCADLVERLDDAGARPLEVALDAYTDYAAVKGALGAAAGHPSVPFVSVGGTWVPSERALEGLRAAPGGGPGTLAPVLAAAGADLSRGFWRR